MGKMIGHAKEHDGLYYLDTRSGCGDGVSLSNFSASLSSNKAKLWLLHCRLGHPSFSVLKVMFPSLFDNLKPEMLHCEVCQLAKHHRVSYPLSNNKASFPFQLIHTDVWGPSRVPNISGARWFVSFIDDCSRVTWLFLMKNKSDVSTILPVFLKMINTQFGEKVKIIRSDNGTEFFNLTLGSFFQKEGIIHQSPCVDTPQQNGVAERKNRHLLDMTRTLLFQNKVPKSYWGEAVLTAAHLINRIPSRVLDHKEPILVLTKFFPQVPQPNSIPPKIFGCPAYVHILAHQRSKLDARALKCVFIGYSPTKKGYKCYHPPSRKFFVSMDVTFNETQSYFNGHYLQGECDSKDSDEYIFESLDLESEPNSTIEPVVELVEPESVSESVSAGNENETTTQPL